MEKNNENAFLICLLIFVQILLLLALLEAKDKSSGPAYQHYIFPKKEKLECWRYRSARICEGKQKIPEEKLEIILSTIDSLHDNVTEKYSMKSNPISLLYLNELDFYRMINFNQQVYAFEHSTHPVQIGPSEIIISTRALDEVKERNNGFIQYYDYNIKNPNRFFDKNFLSHAIVHEYVHAIQNTHPSFLDNYASTIGWKYEGDGYKPPENPGENFWKVNDP
jgi:hypothetical protein